MKVVHIKDINGFFETVDKCKGKVELITGEGDRLNLKSKLSQYIFMSDMFDGATIGDLELIASEPDDIALILTEITPDYLCWLAFESFLYLLVLMDFSMADISGHFPCNPGQCIVVVFFFQDDKCSQAFFQL